MDLIHNTAFRIQSGPDAGIYRVVLDEIQIGKTVVVRLDPRSKSDASRGGRKKLEKTKKPRKKAPMPLVGKLIWMDRADLQHLEDQHQLVILKLETENFFLTPANAALYEERKRLMKPFMDFDHFREQILIHRGIGGLISEVHQTSGCSRFPIYKMFSCLCRFGFHESSLRPRRHNCGAPDIPRPCDLGGRRKSGAKTTKQRIANAYGTTLKPEQPGVSSEWRNMIMAADKHIPTPKPAMPQRCTAIIDSAFVKRYRHENGALVPIDPKLGEYPNHRQIRRVLEREIPRLQRLLEKTTKGHFNRSLRGLIARNWKGVAGPGHTWAIDSTIGDIYLRSSVNPAWIIGRPVVYIIVDVWSTAIVGFYVCLTGPSWDMAKVSLFSSVAPPELLGELWGYQPVLSLNPAPTMCSVLMCDRGEYLSQGAKLTGAKLIPDLSYAPPYRPDLKGLVEVLHRIEKDRQYLFVPGAINQRRQEYELRRFDPNESVMTVRHYTAYLYAMFTEYNLTANRQHRVDAHMAAAGVFPSPAGLWRWGHEMGVGVRRSLPLSELITNLLPLDQGRVTRQGVMFGGNEYRSDIADEQHWTTYARNISGWDIQANYFPGSVSRIWTPRVGGNGLLDLQLSDYSRASPELSFDETLDAFTFAKANSAEVQHAMTLQALEAKRRMEEVIRDAKQWTEEGIARDRGPKPSMTEARQMESALNHQASREPIVEQLQDKDEAQVAHREMMRALFAATNAEGVENV